LASENAKTHTHTAVYTKILLLMEVEVDSSHRTEAPLVVTGESQTEKDLLLAINLKCYVTSTSYEPDQPPQRIDTLKHT
jgi:hypothetical protein